MSNFTFDEVYHIMSTHWTDFAKHFVWELRGADLLGPVQERAAVSGAFEVQRGPRASAGASKIDRILRKLAIRRAWG